MLAEDVPCPRTKVKLKAFFIKVGALCHYHKRPSFRMHIQDLVCIIFCMENMLTIRIPVDCTRTILKKVSQGVGGCVERERLSTGVPNIYLWENVCRNHGNTEPPSISFLWQSLWWWHSCPKYTLQQMAASSPYRSFLFKMLAYVKTALIRFIHFEFQVRSITRCIRTLVWYSYVLIHEKTLDGGNFSSFITRNLRVTNSTTF